MSSTRVRIRSRDVRVVDDDFEDQVGQATPTEYMSMTMAYRLLGYMLHRRGKGTKVLALGAKRLEVFYPEYLIIRDGAPTFFSSQRGYGLVYSFMADDPNDAAELHELAQFYVDKSPELASPTIELALAHCA